MNFIFNEKDQYAENFYRFKISVQLKATIPKIQIIKKISNLHRIIQTHALQIRTQRTLQKIQQKFQRKEDRRE